MTKQILVGGVPVGGGAPVSVQSMTNTDTRDVEATVAQIERLTEAGCNIVRSSVYDLACAKALSQIKTRIHIPIVADIHFDYRLAIAAMENGADKLRFNPGNIGDESRVRAVVERKASLLPAGVTGFSGDFHAGDPVRLDGPDGELVGHGLVNYGAHDLPSMLGRSTRALADELGEGFDRELIHRDALILRKKFRG